MEGRGADGMEEGMDTRGGEGLVLVAAGVARRALQGMARDGMVVRIGALATALLL